MKRFKWISLVVVLASVLIAGCTQSEEPTKDVADEEIVDLAETFIDQLSNGDYEEATENFDETMAAALNAEQLEELWNSLESEFGKYFGAEFDSTVESEGHQVVLMKGIFNDRNVTFQIAFNGENEISGFYIV